MQNLLPQKGSERIRAALLFLILAGIGWYVTSTERFEKSCFLGALRQCYFPYYRNVYIYNQTFRPAAFTTDFYGLKWQGQTGNLIDDSILFYGAYEKFVLFFMRDVLAEQKLPDAVFFDVGSAMGQHSLFMSRYASQVHAFEPLSELVERFQLLAELNEIKNITIHPVGLGREQSKKVFDLEATSFLNRSNSIKTAQLSIVPGDVIVQERGIRRVDLIKIDVEGFEKQVILGLKQTLQRDRPVIVMEVFANQDPEFGFKDEKDFFLQLPENYDLLEFSRKSDGYTGYYELIPAEFGKSDGNLVIFPKEKAHFVPLRGKTIESRDQAFIAQK